MKTVKIKAGERKKIISKFSDSLARSYHFSAQSADDAALSGRIEVQGSQWLLPKNPVFLDLTSNNQVDKGAWDTIYKVYVIPDIDVEISLQGAAPRKWWFYFLALSIATIIAMGIILIIVSA